jgi:hypothetical protein
MTKSLRVFLILGTLCSSSNAALLWLDNFDTPDNGSFDAATPGSLGTRLSGSVGSATNLQSFGAQQSIGSNSALLVGAGGLRFGGQFDRFDWAAGATGSSILAAGGFVVAFDFIPADNTNGEWVSFQVGTINDDNGNLTNDDYGILFRNDGRTERFDNNVNLGPGGTQMPAPAGGITRKVEITYLFSSFADGSSVNAKTTVDGTQLANDTFTWDDNGGAMRMELGSGLAGTRVDNLSISTVPEPSAAFLLLGALGLGARRRR